MQARPLFDTLRTSLCCRAMYGEESDEDGEEDGRPAPRAAGASGSGAGHSEGDTSDGGQTSGSDEVGHSMFRSMASPRYSQKPIRHVCARYLISVCDYYSCGVRLQTLQNCCHPSCTFIMHWAAS